MTEERKNKPPWEKKSTVSRKIMISTLSWEKPSRSRKNPERLWNFEKINSLSWKENLNPLKTTHSTFSREENRLRQEKTQALKPKKKQFSQDKKKSTGDFDKSAQPRKSGHVPQIEAAFSSSPVPWPSQGGSTLWSPGGMKWPDCSGLRQIAARESWLPHQEARLLRFRPSNWGSEETDQSYRLEQWIHLHHVRPERTKKRPTLPEQPQKRTQEPLADVGRDSPLLFSLPHSNLSITSLVRPSLSYCWPTTAWIHLPCLFFGCDIAIIDALTRSVSNTFAWPSWLDVRLSFNRLHSKET